MSQLVAVRSGSAFLEQLRRVTPQGVQLRSVSVDASGTTLSIKVVAQSPEALERLNAFGLNLEDLPAVSAGELWFRRPQPMRWACCSSL